MYSHVYRRVAPALFAALAPGAVLAQNPVAGNAFNPAISLILDGKLASYSEDPDGYSVPGVQLEEESGPAPEGLSLGESELVMSANVDDQFYGQATVALASTDAETEVELEEAFVQTLALPEGFTVRGGRFFSQIGYLNSRHAHTWDFTDQPLAYQALLGTQFGDTGLEVRWLAPLDFYLEAGAEIFRGDAYPAAGAGDQGVGAWTAFAHAGGDVDSEHSWRAGLSYLDAEASGRMSEEGDGDLAFDGSSRIWIADFVWKWSADGNPRTRNFVAQAEYLRRRESGVLALAGPDLDANGTYRGTQSGWYVQGVYQFRPRWRVGLRYDRLEIDNDVAGLAVPVALDDPSDDPSRVTLMVDFSNSEFSRLRLQVAADDSSGESDTRFILQYVMSIGAHGAHEF
jgi:hypothetical protein